MQQHAEAGGDAAVFGFLTAVESPLHGLFGGYLVVDALGRPVEFHCTAPVKVSRAQQILYGPTLHGHLHGRQIGGTLLAESKASPAVVLTDHNGMLQVRPHARQPVAFVQPVGDPAAGPGFVLGAALVTPHASDAADEAAIRDRLEVLAHAVDLREPFERIRAAIEEAQRH
ncbi:MAG: hypothetical protein ACKO4T_06835 [Planctomycetaceae bacterium]